MQNITGPSFTKAAIEKLVNLDLHGFSRIMPETLDLNGLVDQHVLQSAFDFDQEIDATGGRRWRSHSKFLLANGVLTPQEHSAYSQSADYNQDHGGLRRHFRPIADAVLASTTLGYLVRFTESIARESVPSVFEGPDVTVGLHMVSYRPIAGWPSYSSPIWLHRDEEAFVAVVLCGVTCNLGGGESVISMPGTAGIHEVFKLTDRLEMLLLTKKCLHAVTPMYSVDGRPARRDILLVTFS